MQNIVHLFSQATIQELSNLRIFLKNMECAICFHPLSEDHRVLPCNHVFHHACIESWFERSTTCPLCRFRLENDDTEELDLSILKYGLK